MQGLRLGGDADHRPGRSGPEVRFAIPQLAVERPDSIAWQSLEAGLLEYLTALLGVCEAVEVRPFRERKPSALF